MRRWAGKAAPGLELDAYLQVTTAERFTPYLSAIWIADQRYYGEAPGRPAEGSGQGGRNRGQRLDSVWGAKLGSDGSPRRGRRVQGQSRGTARRGVLQASPVTLPSGRAMKPYSIT